MSKDQLKESSTIDDGEIPRKSVEPVQIVDTTVVPIPLEPVVYEQSEQRALIRKIDWRIMPYLWGYAVLSAVDVRNISPTVQ